jgi:hypothetical protein
MFEEAKLIQEELYGARNRQKLPRLFFWLQLMTARLRIGLES